jgi:hypothetical protein
MKLVISLAFKNEIYSIAYDFPLYKLYRIRFFVEFFSFSQKEHIAKF